MASKYEELKAYAEAHKNWSPAYVKTAFKGATDTHRVLGVLSKDKGFIDDHNGSFVMVNSDDCTGLLLLTVANGYNAIVPRWKHDVFSINPLYVGDDGAVHLSTCSVAGEVKGSISEYNAQHTADMQKYGIAPNSLAVIELPEIQKKSKLIKFGQFWAERTNFDGCMCDVKVLNAWKRPIGMQFRTRVDKVGEVIRAATRYPVLMTHGWGKDLKEIFGYKSLENALEAVKDLGFEDECDIFMSSELDNKGFQNYIV